MIKQDFYKVREDGIFLYRTYSDDQTKRIKQVETGRIYTEAIDVFPLKYTYVEISEEELNKKPNIKNLAQMLKNRGVK